MSFKPLNTRDETTSYRKTLLFSRPGWGKTTQAKHYKAKYGKGFIISGEAGLSSIRSEGIDYLPFKSFDGPVIPDKGIYSFTSICNAILSKDFVDAGYKWIMLDSLTELSDLCFEWAEAKAIANAAATGKKQNGFEVWGQYKEKMVGACKFIRDLPYHVIITSLVKESEDDNGDSIRLPLIQGNAVQSQIPGIFDNVFCGVAKDVKTPDGKVETKRFVVTGAYAGWQGKVRDEHNVVQLIEETGDVTSILSKIEVAEKGDKK